MGDVIQTVPLIHRLQHEWPDVAIDLVLDQSVAGVTELVPGLRRVIARDFQDLRSMPASAVVLPSSLADWVSSIASTGYDRVINLTFTRASGLLAAAIGGPDIRGVVSIAGHPIVQNPWLTYCVDRHRFRQVNRFNIADLFALGGSGPGPWRPIQLAIPQHAGTWAAAFLQSNGIGRTPVAVQVGASHVRKAWRPELFGRTLAALSRQASSDVVWIGTAAEAEATDQAMAAFRAAGGTGTLCNAVGQTDVVQLAALLGQCRLLLTNDTGPMHLAVGVGTPVINLSMGHVDFRETGPYGPGQWVIQPDIACGPCELEHACTEYACKDHIMPDQVASLAMHVLGLSAFPRVWSGVRVLESRVDADGLITYRQVAGRQDALADWYGTFWRQYWYEHLTGHTSGMANESGPPDFEGQRNGFRQLAAGADHLVTCAERLRDLCLQSLPAPSLLKAAQEELVRARQHVMPLAMATSAFSPITVMLLRALYDGRILEVRARATQQAQAYRTWRAQLDKVMARLERAIS